MWYYSKCSQTYVLTNKSLDKIHTLKSSWVRHCASLKVLPKLANRMLVQSTVTVTSKPPIKASTLPSCLFVRLSVKGFLFLSKMGSNLEIMSNLRDRDLFLAVECFVTANMQIIYRSKGQISAKPSGRAGSEWWVGRGA